MKIKITPEWSVAKLLDIPEADYARYKLSHQIFSRYFDSSISPPVGYSLVDVDMLITLISGAVNKLPSLRTLSVGAVLTLVLRYVKEKATKEVEQEYVEFAAAMEKETTE